MNPERILFVDDDGELRELIKDLLSAHGFKSVTTAGDGIEALKILKQGKTDLVVLDVMMPHLDGLDLLKIIRENSNVPVILLTAKGEDEDRIQGFEYGADDYLVKPFLTKELILRIKAVLRRAYPGHHNKVLLDFCEIRFDKAEALKNDGTSYNLTAKESKILKKLYENSGCIVSLDALCECAIGENTYGYENTLMSHIRHIREKIEEDPSRPKSLITVRGLGYKLVTKND